MFGIKVCFKERGYWSKAYTYLSDVRYEKGDVVIVPANDFYSIGKVTDCTENPALMPNINYKKVIKKADV